MQCTQRTEACSFRGSATRDRRELCSQLPFKSPSAPRCTTAVTQLSEVLELLIERFVLEVSFLNEVSSQWDFHSYTLARLSDYNSGMEGNQFKIHIFVKLCV